MFRTRRSALLHLACVLVLTAGSSSVFAQDPFPGELPGTEIGASLPDGYEPSGAAWHSRLGKLFVVHDGGTVSMLNSDGTSVSNWSVPGDNEGVCIVDPDSDFVYVGRENPDAVREFDISTGQVTRTFDLTPFMQGPDNSGLEALTFVPDDQHPEGGLFYAGLQSDGGIYVFDLPIRSSATSTAVAHVTTLTPVSGRSDISGLHYDDSTGILYAIWDGSNRIRAMQPDGSLIAEWVLPGNSQEGITTAPCELFIAHDTGKEVWRYGFPTDPGDDDGDGVDNCSDLCPSTPAGATVDADGCPTLPPVPPAPGNLHVVAGS